MAFASIVYLVYKAIINIIWIVCESTGYNGIVRTEYLCRAHIAFMPTGTELSTRSHAEIYTVHTESIVSSREGKIVLRQRLHYLWKIIALKEINWRCNCTVVEWHVEFFQAFVRIFSMLNNLLIFNRRYLKRKVKY